MVKGKRKYIQFEFFRMTAAKKEEDGGGHVEYEVTIHDAALTDEEEARLKDIVRKAAEEANEFLGW